MQFCVIISQRAELATLDAVATHHATAVVHLVVLEIYAGGLAILRAQRTVFALIFIEMNLQD